MAGKNTQRSKSERPNPIEVEKHLKGIKFPASKQDLIEHARQNDAPEEVLSTLEQMPDREFGNAADVAKGVGQIG
jgi:hypothetical protein